MTDQSYLFVNSSAAAAAAAAASLSLTDNLTSTVTSTCVLCPMPGSQCVQPGVTIDVLASAPGFWRLLEAEAPNRVLYGQLSLLPPPPPPPHPHTPPHHIQNPWGVGGFWPILGG
jgi:hypothetical protein